MSTKGTSSSTQLIHAQTKREEAEARVEELEKRIHCAIAYMAIEAPFAPDARADGRFALRSSVTMILRGEE